MESNPLSCVRGFDDVDNMRCCVRVENCEGVIVGDDAIAALDTVAHKRAVSGVDTGFLQEFVTRVLPDTADVHHVAFDCLCLVGHANRPLVPPTEAT